MDGWKELKREKKKRSIFLNVSSFYLKHYKATRVSSYVFRGVFSVPGAEASQFYH